jgi:recombination protein RecA
MARKDSSPSQTDDSKNIALDKALDDITKRYGDGSIMRLGEAHQLLVDVIPTGSL